MIEIDEAKIILGELVKNKRLILFVGSGISKDSNLPSWEGFLDEFINFCNDLAHNYNSKEISEIFEHDLIENASQEKGKNPVQVATVLKSKLDGLPENVRKSIEIDFKKWFFRLFINAKPNRKHELIVSTEYPFILTSNYDNLLEDAQKKVGFPYHPLSFTDTRRIAESIYLDRPSIIHVHGECSDVLLDKIILTSEDYVRIIKKGYPGFSFAIQSLFLRHSALFVGYGASDPHLEDLIEEFSYFFGFPDTTNLSTNFLVVKREKAGRILNDYKKRMRTELIAIDDFSQYEDLLNYLYNCAPRKLKKYND